MISPHGPDTLQVAAMGGDVIRMACILEVDYPGAADWDETPPVQEAVE